MGFNWRDYRAPVLAAAQYLAQGLLWGALAGFLIAGLGGRLAMLVLRLTSDPALAGTQTDDDFTIGAITGATFFLVLLTTIAGAMGGLLYALARRWIPERYRVPIAGLFAAVAIGTLTINPGGIDFTALEPLWLAVAMFIALPAAYGVVASWLIERSYARGLRVHPALALLLPVLPLVLQGVAGIGLMLAAGLLAVAVIAANRQGLLSGLWRSSMVTWAGRGPLAVVFVLASVALYRDVTEVL